MIRISIDPDLSQTEFDTLMTAGWGSSSPGYLEAVLPRSLAYLGAYADDRLVGFVNIAWDGGIHAFILDTVVHPDFRRRGIASDLVRNAAKVAKERGARCLHVDFEPHLADFYFACGFRPTEAGLIAL